MRDQVGGALGSDPDERAVHEIVRAERDDRDAVPARQRRHVGDAAIGGQRIHVGAVHVVDPFDGIQAGRRRAPELLTPAIAREALEQSTFGWQQPALHDGESPHLTPR